MTDHRSVSGGLPHFSSEAIAALVPFPDVVSALRSAFSQPLAHIDRVHTSIAGGDYLMMGATLPHGDGEGGEHAVAGAKLIMVQPRNVGTERRLIAGAYVLFDADRGIPIATLDGTALTNMRTPAVSVVAAQALGSANPTTAVIVGQGVQGKAHAAAFAFAFPSLQSIEIVGREAFVSEGMSEGVGGPISRADHIVGATSSVSPWLRVSMVKPGAHITLVGAYRPDMREVCSDVVVNSQVFVDQRSAAEVEAGDLICAVSDGWSFDSVAGDLADLSRLPTGEGSSLRGGKQFTLFKSVGLAVEDVVVARLVAHRAGLFSNDQ